jgi:hypothetical protein
MTTRLPSAFDDEWDGVISEITCHDLESLIAALRAVEELGLGARVENRWIQVDDRIVEERWVLHLLQGAVIESS